MSSRPIADFHPCPWGHHFLNLTHHPQEKQEEEIRRLKEEVQKEVLGKEALEELKLIDEIQRLGLAYHFQEEIDNALSNMFQSYQILCLKFDLFHVSLLFRILRQHGFHVSSDVFKKFKDEEGSLKECLTNDIPGMLSLYEASHVRVEGDDILKEAVNFTTTHLKKATSDPLAEEVAHALNQSLHRGVPRLESRHYISFYEKHPSHNHTLLKLAKLDFNFLQALHKKELSELVSWWKTLHSKAFSFSRDRSAEAFFWILGTYYEPHYSKARKIFSKLFKIVSLMDDTYDAYGTLEELQLLTHAIQKWDEGCIDELPEHVKLSYQTLLQTFKEVEQELQEEEGSSFGVLYAQQQMKQLSRAYLQEAKWCDEKHVPTHDEYIENGVITSAYPFGVVASFLGMGEIASKEAFEWVSQHPSPKPLRASAIICRLLNDLGGHKFEQSRNHVASSVQCHVTRHGATSEEEAHEAIQKKVEEAWKELNEGMLRPFAIPKPLLDRILNLARVSDVIYKGEDGYTNVSQAMKDRVAALLLHPIPI